MLTALTEWGEIRRARVQFYKNLRSTVSVWRDIGTQGGTNSYKFWWHPDPGLWVVLEASENGNRSWNCFGTGDPTQGNGAIAPSCEINFPHEGINRSVAGLFARDVAGHVHVVHSGKIGGGRPGISKSRFVEFFSGSDQWEEIFWPDDEKVTAALDLGPVDAEDLVFRIHHFVRAVEQFKERAEEGQLGEPAELSEDDGEGEPSYTPEFSGKRASYTVGAIESRCDHGRIVDALRETLQAALPGRSFRVGNTRHHDLYLARSNKMVAHFEVKTDAALSSIYTAIGQLMYHNSGPALQITRIIVLPEALGARGITRLNQLGFKVLLYRWVRNRPAFPALRQFLARLDLTRS